MRTFLWPAEDGWPYPDGEPEVTDPSADLDDDLVSLLARSPHLFDGLDEIERQVVTRHYGLDGQPPQTMKELHADLGLSRTALREVLGGGLQKLRANLIA
ncbi:MAG: hypothetical protein M3N68_07780 [Actinomycetota bacterium]|nr:hypothetical protein [Actinomycetota bacterium]